MFRLRELRIKFPRLSRVHRVIDKYRVIESYECFDFILYSFIFILLVISRIINSVCVNCDASFITTPHPSLPLGYRIRVVAGIRATGTTHERTARLGEDADDDDDRAVAV